jgi:hypothetical protein
MKRKDGSDPLLRLWSSSGVADVPDSGSRSWSFVLFRGLSMLRIGGRETGVWCRIRWSGWEDVTMLSTGRHLKQRASTESLAQSQGFSRWGYGTRGRTKHVPGRGCDPVYGNPKSGLRHASHMGTRTEVVESIVARSSSRKRSSCRQNKSDRPPVPQCQTTWLKRGTIVIHNVCFTPRPANSEPSIPSRSGFGSNMNSHRTPEIPSK